MRTILGPVKMEENILRIRMNSEIAKELNEEDVIRKKKIKENKRAKTRVESGSSVAVAINDDVETARCKET